MKIFRIKALGKRENKENNLFMNPEMEISFHVAAAKEKRRKIPSRSVKHSTIDEMEKISRKFSRHVFEQFLSICFIHLHVCLTNSEIK